MEGKSPQRFLDLIFVCRALARDTDGDFTKFVQSTKKPRDEAQKWRAFKNISRFMKHQIGYMYWKTEVFSRQNRMRFLYINMVYMLF